MRIYISSTAKDLAEYREAVIQALRKAGHQPICMECYAAQDAPPLERCLADIAESDLYIGILAFRYGFIPANFDTSITELEYRQAVASGIHTLFFLPQEGICWESESHGTAEGSDKLERFKNEIKAGKIVDFYNNPDHLGTIVLAGVQQVERSRIFAKMTVANTASQNTAVEDAISALREQLERNVTTQQDSREPIPICLPSLNGMFVDRQLQRDTLHHWLRREKLRLVAIVAPGGYGKTELTTKLLQEITSNSQIIVDDVHGIIYLKCVGGDLCLGTIFEHAGRVAGKRKIFQETYASRELSIERKLEFFFDQLSKIGNIWVVMDNFEDLLDPLDDRLLDPELNTFMEMAGAIEHRVRLIATTRAIPDFRGSRRMKRIDLSGGLPEAEAIRYLREEGIQYGLADIDEKLLISFVNRVHGIPKALDSVLGFLEDHYPAISLEDIVANESLFADFDVHDAEAGLKKLIAEQFKSLSPEVQLVLCVLSVFPKAVPEAALRFMLPSLNPGKLASIISRLFRNRLIYENKKSYSMHPIVQDYIYQQLPAGECALNVCSEVQASPKELSRLQLHAIAADFFHALEMPTTKWVSIQDIEPQVERFYHLAKAECFDNAAQLLEEIDEYLFTWGHFRTLISMREKLIGHIADAHLNIVNLNQLGVVYAFVSEVKNASKHLLSALSMAMEVGDIATEADILKNIGINHYYQGRMREAAEYYDGSLKLSRELKDRLLEGKNLCNLGFVYRSLGYANKSIPLFEKALLISRELADRAGEGYDLCCLGNAFYDLGHLEKSLQYYNEALQIEQEVGHRRRVGYTLGNLGIPYLRMGKIETAIEFFNEALTISREIGDRRVEWSCLRNLAMAFSINGKYSEAVQALQKAHELAIFCEDKGAEGRILTTIGDTEASIGNLESAIQHYKLAIQIGLELDYPSISAHAKFGLGLTCHCAGDLSDAQSHYLEASALDIVSLEPFCNIYLGILGLELRNPDADQLLSEGINLCKSFLTRSSVNFEYRYALAAGLLGLGCEHEAVVHYREALSVCSTDGVIDSAKRDLFLLSRAMPDSQMFEISKLFYD